MDDVELQLIFRKEHKRLSDDWHVRMKRQILMQPLADERVIFQNWSIAQIAMISASLKRLMLEAKREKSNGRID